MMIICRAPGYSWANMPGTVYEYVLIDDVRAYFSAVEGCASYGGELAFVKSLTEEVFINGLLVAR